MIINHLQGLTGTWAETNTQPPLRQGTQKIKHDGALFSEKGKYESLLRMLARESE